MNLNDLFSNRDSFVSRLIRHKARRLVRHAAFNKSEIEDIEQELALEVVRKFDRFDPAKGASEITFIARILKNKAISLVRTRVAKKRDFRRNGRSLSKTVRDPDGGSVEQAQTLDDSLTTNHSGHVRRTQQSQSELRLDTAEVLNSLPDELHELADLLKYMSEYSASQVLGRSRRQVANDMRLLCERFADAQLREYV